VNLPEVYKNHYLRHYALSTAFSSFNDMINEKIATVESLVDMNKITPLALRSKSHFRWLVFIPFLVLFLSLQLLFAFATSMLISSGASGLISSSIQTYLTTALQQLCTFASTSFDAIVANINSFIGWVENEVNIILNDEMGPLFEQIFKDGFKTILTKMVDIMEKMEKIEKASKKVATNLRI